MQNSLKWYDSPETDSSAIISSRVRLARNLANYPFPTRLSDDEAEKMIQEVKKSIMNDRTYLGNEFDYVDLTNASQRRLAELMEKHSISREMMIKKSRRALLINRNETVSLMLNEEDHARLQTVFPGENIDEAFKTADLVDSLIEESVRYAFDFEFGYLTSCPTNAGTGMRASYMLHIPMLESEGYVSKLLNSIGKMGFALRGTHGEGTKSMGAIYQLSNQVTLGKSEQDIIAGLKNVAAQIIEKENELLESRLRKFRLEMEDRLYRSYGLLTNCRKISCNEAVSLLSDVRLGFISGIFGFKCPSKTIYNIMMNVQESGIINQVGAGGGLDQSELEAARADYLRKVFQVQDKKLQ